MNSGNHVDEGSKQKRAWRPQDADREGRAYRIEEIRAHIQNTNASENAVFIPANPSPSIDDEGMKNVGVYARVSTSSMEQVSSIENQTKFYTEKVEKTPNWELFEIYSDEGKSGTSMRKRMAFRKMMDDAKDGKIDLIVCASVSRFARNVADCMTNVQELKTWNPKHPVGVYFETENIYTLDPSSYNSLGMHALLADWESANKSRRMILSYDQRICMGQYPLADLLGYRHTKDGRLVIQDEEAKTVRLIFLARICGYTCDEIAEILTEKERPTLKGRTEWNGSMVRNIMKNERRWGDLSVRKTVVVDYTKGKTVKNDRIRDAAFVAGHHEAIVPPEYAKAVKYLSERGRRSGQGLSDLSVIKQGKLKGFVNVSPTWSGIDDTTFMEASRSAYEESELLTAAYAEGISEEVFGDYQVPNGGFFINSGTPNVTISKTQISINKKVIERFSAHEYVEVLYNPVIQTMVIRSCDKDSPNAIALKKADGKPLSTIAAYAFCSAIFDRMDWIKDYRFRIRGISRTRGEKTIMFFNLDEPQVLIDKSKQQSIGMEGQTVSYYIPCHNSDIESNVGTSRHDWGMPLGMKRKRDSLINSISESDISAAGQIIDNPLLGKMPTRAEFQSELNALILSM